MAYTTINKSTDYFTPTLYVGNGSTKTVTGVPFEPDMTWLKNRSAVGDNEIYDKLRGATYRIYPNATAAQDSLAEGLKAWTSDGFTVGTNTAINGNGNNIVSWNWKANGQGSSNTDGSINTTYTSVNNTSGFSISSFTGTGSNATIGTGLTSKPACVIIKNLTDGGTEWMIGHQGLATNAFSSNKYIHFNTAATSTNSSSWNSTEPTSNGIVSLGDGSYANGSGKNYICYAFTEKQGYSKFGSYIGNENADGAFTYTGFKPAFVMIKNATQAGDRWIIHDNKRDVDNGCNHRLFPDGNIVESTSTTSLDFLSNGFKQRTDAGTSNTNGQTYIYMAFAEAPLVGSNNVPANAR